MLPFTTLQREVTVSFNQLQVMNDGDPIGDATANFQWKIFEANNNNRPVSELREIRSFSFDMDVRSTNLYNLTDVHVQGPERVFSDNRFMFVNVSGEEEDGFLEMNEHSRGEKFLHFPKGRGAEEVSDREISLYASPINDEDFSFYVFATYSVKYRSP